MESYTAIWYQKKEKLINGPTIPNSILEIPVQGSFSAPMSVRRLCSATLNRSHVMLIVDSTKPCFQKVVIFNSVENSWYFISDLQLEYDLEYTHLTHCRASVAIDKSGKK